MFRWKKVNLFEGAAVLNIQSREKFSAIEELINKAPIFKFFHKRKQLLHAVIDREKEKTTGFGHGIAVAHGSCGIVKNISIAVGLSRQGIEYCSCDGNPVHILFLIASPPSKCESYLKTLAALMMIMRNKDFRDRLLSAESEQEAEQLLRQSFEMQPRSFTRFLTK